MLCVGRKKALDGLFHSSHTKPIASIDERRSPLKFSDKMTEEAMIFTKIRLLDTTLRNNAAVVGLLTY